MKLSTFRSTDVQHDFERLYQRGMNLLPDPDAQIDVPTSFGTVRVYRFGTAAGTPVVLLPGRAATTVMWGPNLDRLTAERTVYAIEPLGEPGPSRQTCALRTPSDQADWLTEVLAALPSSPVHLVGYSFGGWLACNLLIRGRAAAIASATLIDPVFTFGRFPLGLLMRTALTTVPVIAGPARRHFMRWVVEGAPLPENDPAADIIEAGLGTFRSATPIPTYPTDDELRSIGAPVLVVIAGRSVMHHPGRALQRAQRLIPGVRAELWPAATHAIVSETPEAVDRTIHAFVGAVERARA